MKKWLVGALLIVGMTTFAQEAVKNTATNDAKPKREQLNPEQRAQRQLQKLTATLNLTPAQQKEVEKILIAQNEKREANFAAHKADKDSKKTLTKEERKAKKSEMEANRTAVKEQFQKILTPEQLVKLDKLNSEKRQKRAENHKKSESSTNKKA